MPLIALNSFQFSRSGHLASDQNLAEGTHAKLLPPVCTNISMLRIYLHGTVGLTMP